MTGPQLRTGFTSNLLIAQQLDFMKILVYNLKTGSINKYPFIVWPPEHHDFKVTFSERDRKIASIELERLGYVFVSPDKTDNKFAHYDCDFLLNMNKYQKNIEFIDFVNMYRRHLKNLILDTRTNFET